MASTKQMEKIWNVSSQTIASWCASGLIPSADKISGRWDIPQDAPKPPCTCYMAYRYLLMIASVQEGAEPDFTLLRKPDTAIVDCFQYLKEAGFCTKISWKSDQGTIDFMKSLKDVRITDAGKALMENEKKKLDKETKKKISASFDAKVGGGILPGEASIKVSTEKEV